MNNREGLSSFPPDDAKVIQEILNETNRQLQKQLDDLRTLVVRKERQLKQRHYEQLANRIESEVPGVTATVVEDPGTVGGFSVSIRKTIQMIDFKIERKQPDP